MRGKRSKPENIFIISLGLIVVWHSADFKVGNYFLQNI